MWLDELWLELLSIPHRTTTKDLSATSPVRRKAVEPSAHQATALKLAEMAIKPITGVCCIANWLYASRIRTDLMRQMLRRGLVLDLSVALGMSFIAQAVQWAQGTSVLALDSTSLRPGM